MLPIYILFSGGMTIFGRSKFVLVSNTSLVGCVQKDYGVSGTVGGVFQ